ncbi:MAG: MoaD/ThiS family protein [Candidatus Thorarchaeota archaeon]
MTKIFVKLMNRGLKSHEHDKFAFETETNSTVRDLIDELQEDYADRFEVFYDDKENGELRRDTIIIVNGQNMVAKDGLKTKLSEGDLIVFMIAAVGG